MPRTEPLVADVGRPLDVLVVGGGATGMAAAARIAKLGHGVTIVDGGHQVGGHLRALSEDEWRWDASPPLITLPAVLRDLFRKSGRPVERYVDMDVPPVARLHLFDDGSRARYVTGSRAGQHDALADDLGTRAARSWTQMVDDLADVWQTLHAAIAAPDPLEAWRTRDTRRTLMTRRSREWLVARSLPDRRLRSLATWRNLLQGVLSEDAPAWTATDLYVERAMGLWLVEQGPGALGAALEARLRERRVSTITGTQAVGLIRDRGRVSGIVCDDGTRVPADHVVSTVREPWSGELRGLARVRTAAWSHLRVRRTVPAPAPEIVLHGSSPTGSDDILARATGIAPEGYQAWSVGHRGTLAQAVARLDAAGILARSDVLAHHTSAPRSVPHTWVAGTAGQLRAARFRDARAGLSVVGPSGYPGPDLHFALWGAALVAEQIGAAPRTSS